MLSKLSYGAFAQYSPRGVSKTSVRSRQARDTIKAGRDKAMSDLSSLILKETKKGEHLQQFRQDCTLIPVPRSAPLRDKNSLWVPKKICEALINVGLGTDLSECLVRVRAVKKSAFQAPGERVSPQEHYDSFEVEKSLLLPRPNIVLIDDFVSRGRTLIAAASRIAVAFPQHSIWGFAMVRTKGREEVDTIILPYEGTIVFDGNDANRMD